MDAKAKLFSEEMSRKEPEPPTETELDVTEEKAEFLFEKAAQINFLVDLAGRAHSFEDLGLSLAGLMIFAFNAGIEFSKPVIDREGE